jgi:REP element-mobilizing transposase RayT
MTPADAVHKLKGMSAKGLFQQLPHLRRLYKKGSLWSPGKFMGSVGHITLEKAKKYIEAHHAKEPPESSLFCKAKKSSEGRVSTRGGRQF